MVVVTTPDVVEETTEGHVAVRVFEDGYVSVTNTATGNGFDIPGEMVSDITDALEVVPDPEECEEMYREYRGETLVEQERPQD